jgi:hypothetical protein
MKPEFLGQVTITELRRFLLQEKWEVVPHPNPLIEVFNHRDSLNGDASLLLPQNEEIADASQIINEALHILAQTLELNTSELLHKITGWARDVFRARLFRLAGSENTLPLDVASNYITNLRKFIGHAAFTESSPKASFERAGAASNDFIRHCRFGHTFHGSFGITVESPVQITPMLGMDGVEPYIPFERKVFERIATGFKHLKTSTQTESIAPLLTSYHTGLNANMCRALSAAYESADGRRIEYDLSWCPELKPNSFLGWEPFIFDGRAYEFSQAAALELERIEGVPECMIEGRVYALKSETPPGLDEQKEFDHVITMYWERERTQTVGVRVPLNPNQYITACDAHKDGRKIRIWGVPEKQGKYWTLTKCRDFSVVPGS